MMRTMAALLLYLVCAQEQGARWAHFTPENSGLAALTVLDVIEAEDGAMWFVHPDALSRFDAYQWRTYPADYALPDDTSTELTESLTPRQPHGTIYRTVLDSRGAVWLATDTGAFRLAPDPWEEMIPAFRGMAHYQIRDILEDSYGILWFAAYDPISGEGSLSGLDPEGRWLFFNAHVEPGLASNQITALAEDRYGGLWAGTAADGVSRYLGSTWAHMLPDEPIAGLTALEGGRVICAQTGSGAVGCDVEAGVWREMDCPPPPVPYSSPDPSARFMAEGRDGRRYFGAGEYALVYAPRPPAPPTIIRQMRASVDEAVYTITTGAWWPADALAYEVTLRGAPGAEEDVNIAQVGTYHQATATVQTAALEPGAYTLCARVFTPLQAAAKTCARLVVP